MAWTKSTMPLAGSEPIVCLGCDRNIKPGGDYYYDTTGQRVCPQCVDLAGDMDDFQVGDRVELEHCDDERTRLVPGTTATTPGVSGGRGRGAMVSTT